MDIKNKNQIIFQILSSEQQILQRTDQKAFTILSILGVFSVFFIVHFSAIHLNYFNLVFIIIYFVNVLIAIIYLVRVIAPRVVDTEEAGKSRLLPTFFSGISQYKSPEDYAGHLDIILENSEEAYSVFAESVYSLGKINSIKNKNLRRGIFFFIIAVTSELVIILSLYTTLTLETF